MTSQPTFRELEPTEMEAILARNNVGRIAYSMHDRIGIEPIHYVYRDGWLYGRTAPGIKVRILEHRPWVAFEVDEVEGLFDWRSVVVRGTIHFPDPDGASEERELHAQAVEALRDLLPTTLSPSDPTPFRNLVFGIHASDMSGRTAQQTPQ